MPSLLTLYALGFMLLCNVGFAQTLQHHQSFGTGGFSVTNLSNEAPNFAYCISQQSDGKMLMAGSTLTRLFTNGNVDSSFGTNGLAGKAGFPFINAMAVQPDDKIICAYNDYYKVLLKRFTAAGILDSSFGSNGQVEMYEPNKLFFINALKLQPDGKIVVAGSSTTNDKSGFFIARFLNNGMPDLSFNSNGKQVIDLSAYNDIAYDIVIQSSGKIIAGGSSIPHFGLNPKLVVIRLNTDGSRDMNFNTTGILVYSSASGSGEAAYLLQRYPDDRILIAGNSNGQILLMRLLADGNMDVSFSTDGWLTEAGQGLSRAKQLKIFNNNSILVSGHTSQSEPINWDYAAFKFDAAGNADNSFNGNGKTWLSFAANDYSAGSILRNDGSILMGGYNDASLLPHTALINSSGSFNLSHGSNGIKYLKINGTDEQIYKLLKQSDNKIIAIGKVSNELGTINGTALVKYKTDGSIDSSFGTNGIVSIEDPSFVFHSALLQSDQKIILAGNKYSGGEFFENNIALIRLNNNGAVDNGFGLAGTVLLSSSITNGFGNAAVLSDNGSIVVAGKDYVNFENIVVFRILNNGSLDNEFGSNGRTFINLGLQESQVGSVALQPDGKIIIGGHVIDQNGLSGFFCLRLLANAAIDNTFASNGIYKTTPAAVSFIELYSLFTTPDHKIIFTGFVTNPSGITGSVAVVKLLSNGSTDNSFNGSGINFYYKSLHNDSTYNIPYAAALHPDSSLYITGEAHNLFNEQQTFIIRIKQNGNIDPTLAADGSGWHIIGTAVNKVYANDIFINSSDSTIFIGGVKTTTGNNDDFLIAAYKRLPDITGITYVFNGNGLWTNSSNWLNGIVPPATLPNGASIVVSTAPGGTCILNIKQTIAAGGNIMVSSGAQMLIQGDLITGQ
jgi:uncharacterized delta-60 repeat protein